MKEKINKIKKSDKIQRIIRKKYSPQFKDQVLERAERDGAIKAAKDLGLSPSMIYSWKSKKNKGGDSIENQKLQEGELAKLKRMVDQLTMENVFLKKAAAYFAKEQK